MFFGAWKVFPLVTGLALWGALMIGALYLLRAMRNVLHGPLPEKWSGIPDASSVWRKLPYALLLASLLVFGCFPRLLTEKITPDAAKIVSLTDTGTNVVEADKPRSSPAVRDQSAQYSVTESQSRLTSAATESK